MTHSIDYNIFADLGLPDADMHMVKAQAVLAIGKVINQLGITQQEAAAQMGIAQSDVAKLLRGCFDGFSLFRLFELLRAFGFDIEITFHSNSDNEHAGTMRLVMS